MKADDALLLDLLKKSTQFVVPIYQRVYSWGDHECQRLWDDIMYAGAHEQMGAHFTGSIVYVERDEGTKTSAEPDLIIDGQQRVTTVMLILAALADHLEQQPPEEQEPVEGFAPKKIRSRYLTNADEDGERFFKLVLSKSDRDAFKAVIQGTPTPPAGQSRVARNHESFRRRLEDNTDLQRLCLGLRKLVVVDVKLTRGSDNPQLVFETMNSTGKKLTEADLIRNYVLMDLAPSKQNALYGGYWSKMEEVFSGVDEGRFDEFVRHYLTLKTGSIPRVDDIYEAFKAYSEAEEGTGTPREALVPDLYAYANRFAAMALGAERDARLDTRFRELEALRATVVYPFMLRVYSDYEAGRLSVQDVMAIVEMLISYLFRRAVCQIPTNSHNKTFANLAASIDPTDYVDSVAARLLTLPSYTRFPTDEEFTTSLTTGDVYHFKRAPYLFRKLENEGRKEPISTADYTIEHILPQNENLPTAWREDLGPNWSAIQDKYLHTLGNLTLTGYNPEYSDRAFTQKRDMTGGFAESPLRLNLGLGKLNTWGPRQIEERALQLAEKATRVWARPALPETVLSKYRDRFASRSGFDWSLAHQILENLPAGRWTAYYSLAEAAGTAPAPLGNHLAKCPTCKHPYRVLTWDGRIAGDFHWSDPTDTRDPRQMLEHEGVRFNGDTADPEQRLVTEDLLALLDD